MAKKEPKDQTLNLKAKDFKKWPNFSDLASKKPIWQPSLPL